MWDQLLLLLPKDNPFLQGGLVMMALGTFIAYARSFPRRLYQLWLRYFTVTVKLVQGDGGFNSVTLWLAEHPYNKRARSLTMRNMLNDQVFVPAPGWHWFMHKGLPLVVYISDENGDATSAGQSRTRFITMRSIGRSRKTIEDLIAEAQALYKAKNRKERLALEVYIASGKGWNMSYSPKRKLDTLFLTEEQRAVLGDIRAWMTRREWYTVRGIPYRRGFLFHGPPGTGKSSIVTGLASELDCDVYILNPAGWTDDMVAYAISSVGVHLVGKPAILLIEDIDTVTEKRALPMENPFQGTGNGVAVATASNPKLPSMDATVPNLGEGTLFKPFALGTLLNALDGVGAKENLIVIMTSNRPEALDPALIRPGRVDKKVAFGYATKGQIAEACHTYFPTDGQRAGTLEAEFIARMPLTMADVQQRLQEVAV